MRYSVEPDRPSMGNPSPDSKERVRRRLSKRWEGGEGIFLLESLKLHGPRQYHRVHEINTS